MDKMFEREHLEKAFAAIGANFGRLLDAYLLGGGAMCFRNQKAGTKDLDIVFKSGGDARLFSAAARKTGFHPPKRMGKIYLKMDASNILEDKGGFRLDIFSKTVCRALSLSERMILRSERFGEFGNLRVWMVANEDVILFKGITEREKDVDDIAAVVRLSKINWNIVLEECKSQSGNGGWYGPLLDKLFELEEKHGMEIPIKDELERLYHQGLVREKFQRLLSEGKSRKAALAKLRKTGFEKDELEFL